MRRDLCFSSNVNCVQCSGTNSGFLWFLQMVITCVAVIWLINPISENIYFYTGVIAIWLFITFIKYNHILIEHLCSKNSMVMYMWLIILFLYSVCGHAEFKMSYITYLFTMLMGSFFIKIKDIKICKCVLIVSMLYLCLIAYKTLMAYHDRPAISRILAYGDPEKIIKAGGIEYLTPFIAGYDIIYGFVIICAVMLLLSIEKKKIFLIPIVLLFSCVVFLAQYFIAISIYILAVSFVFISTRKNQREAIIVAFCFSFSILIMIIFGKQFFLFLANLEGISNNISYRLREVADFFSGNLSEDGDIAGRSYYYSISINSFFEHLLFGCGTNGTIYQGYGNHSTILDAFAVFGMFGGTFFLLYYISSIIYISNQLSFKGRKIYKFCFCILLLLAFINRADCRIIYAVVYIIVPFLILLSEEKENEYEYTDNSVMVHDI